MKNITSTLGTALLALLFVSNATAQQLTAINTQVASIPGVASSTGNKVTIRPYVNMELGSRAFADFTFTPNGQLEAGASYTSETDKQDIEYGTNNDRHQIRAAVVAPDGTEDFNDLKINLWVSDQVQVQASEVSTLSSVGTPADKQAWTLTSMLDKVLVSGISQATVKATLNAEAVINDATASSRLNPVRTFRVTLTIEPTPASLSV